MSTLVEHARRELDLLGEEPSFAACLAAVVGAYASWGHSGGSHVEAVRMLTDLLNFRPLTPITADPDEWIDRSEMSGTPLWQNDRDSRAMSGDGGRTYWLVENRLPGSVDVYEAQDSALPPAWVKLMRQSGLDEQAAAVAIGRYLDAGPLTDEDRQALDEAPDKAAVRRYLLQRWGAPAAAVAWALYRPSSVGAPPLAGAA